MSDKPEVNLDPEASPANEQPLRPDAEVANGEVGDPAGQRPDETEQAEQSEQMEAATDSEVDQPLSTEESAEAPSEQGEVANSIDDQSPAEDELAEDELAEAENENAVEEDEPVAVAPAGPVELDVPEPEEISLEWYILKVQSNRERSISDALKRKVAIEGLDDYFGEILVPTEKVTEFKGGKKKIVERKLWPGYIAVQMHVNDDTWFAIRETSGIGDFTGSGGKPTPMQPSEIALILRTDVEETTDAPKLDIKFSPGDKVKVKEGNFENFEGEVSGIDETHGRVTVMLSIFGRPTPVELEYWQVEGV